MDNVLLKKALEMPPNERVIFAELVLASIDHEDEEIRQSWIAEATNRMKAVSEGRSKLLDYRNLNIGEMSTEEKMQAMELLWDDFCRRQPDFSSPAWHEDILNQRAESVREGKDKFVDWEQAKKEIRESLL